MWTPRRIVLALFGLLACATGYVAYARGLGTFDGLPPLPPEFLPKDDTGNPPPPPVFTSTMDKKFQQAFGANCPEIGYPIKTELKGRHVLVAARDFKILKSGERVGWVELLSLSLAAFGQKLDGSGGEQRVSLAFLVDHGGQLRRELVGRIVGAQVRGNVAFLEGPQGDLLAYAAGMHFRVALLQRRVPAFHVFRPGCGQEHEALAAGAFSQVAHHIDAGRINPMDIFQH